MAVITAEGVVGKVLRVFRATSQVLLVNDQTSGVGAILEKSRLQGVLRGTPLGEVVLEKVMSDEAVQPGDKLLTSGGDQIFPKGLPVGTVTKVSPGSELFLNIRVKPAVDLNRLEELLVITQQEEKEPALAVGGLPMRAADILAQRLPSVPDRPPDDPNKPPPPTSGLKISPALTAPGTPNSQPSGAATAHAKANQGQGQGITAPNAHPGSTGVAIKSGIDTSATQPTVKPAAVKPASTKKPARPAEKASSDATNAASATESQPTPAKPSPPADQTAPQPLPQEQPQ
jgi:rod shape-determining protein MreC